MPDPFPVNFTIRPAKNIERKMLREAFSHLWPFARVSSYRYIGFGSKFFNDFSLFHKALGITHAISIEKDHEHGDRYEFNKPFDCIDIVLGESNDVLPTLSWDAKTIAWLDYESKLRDSELLDVRFFCASAAPGSVLVVTVNVHPDEFRANRLTKLKRRIVDPAKIPMGLRHKDLADWGLAAASRRIITNEIEETLAARNALGPTPIRYQQLFNFQYQDRARMLTLGGILYDEGQETLLARCGFQRLDFISMGQAPYELHAPNLTLREVRHLDRQLPNTPAEELEAPGVPVEDLIAYHRVYRYFPAFVEAEM